MWWIKHYVFTTHGQKKQTHIQTVTKNTVIENIHKIEGEKWFIEQMSFKCRTEEWSSAGWRKWWQWQLRTFAYKLRQMWITTCSYNVIIPLNLIIAVDLRSVSTNTGRQLGLWTRAVNSGSGNRPLMFNDKTVSNIIFWKSEVYYCYVCLKVIYSDV